MLCSRHEEAWARLLSLCPPNTNVTVSAIYRCHWGRARSPLRSAAPDRRPMHQSRKLHRLFYRASVSSLGSQKSSADLEETGIALIAPAWPTATFGSATKLFIADHRQYWSQPLVIGDSALVDVGVHQGWLRHSAAVKRTAKEGEPLHRRGLPQDLGAGTDMSQTVTLAEG